jgi:carboxymethylenebutenolidase
MTSDPLRDLVRGERVGIPLDVGAPMSGYLACPDPPGDHPGVLVAMELFGVDAYVREVCDDLARLGFTALAPDFHHRAEPGAELPRDEAGRARGFELLNLLTREGVLADVDAAVRYLRDRGVKVAGMVGLSLGGHIAYLAATACDLANVAVFYGGWLTGTDIPLSRPEPTLALTDRITGRVLYLVGEDDHVIPADDQREIAAALTKAGGHHTFVAYPGVGHGFLRTDPAVAADAWSRVEALLRGE